MRNSNLNSELGNHVMINREIAKTCRMTRKNSGKSRKNVCYYSPIPQYLSAKFPIKKCTCNFPPLCKVWANFKMVFLRYESFKNRGVFPILRLFFDIYAHSTGGIWLSGKFYIGNVVLNMFLEDLGLCASKLSKDETVQNDAKNMENLKNS